MPRLGLSWLQTRVLENPRRVIGITLALVLVAALLGANVELRKSRSELAPADDPDQRRWSELLEEYGGSETLIACVTARDPARSDGPSMRRHVDRLAEAFARDPRVAGVFHRLDLTWFERHALHLADGSDLVDLLDRLEPRAGEAGRLPSDLAGFNRSLAEGIERAFRESSTAGDGAGEGVATLASFLGAQRDWLRDPEAVAAPLRGPFPLLALAGDRAPTLSQGYLQTRDGSIAFALISPSNGDDSLVVMRDLLRGMRTIAERVGRAHPGFDVAFTGQPALVVEEMDAVRRDTFRSALIAVLGVGALTFLVFRWRSHALLVLLALFVGVVWSLGAVKLELGYLNLITSSFVSTLIGVGVAYGIHPVSEYELEGAHHVDDPAAAVRAAFRQTGPGITVAALTTAAAFFSIQFMNFRGFAELGIVAGVGVLLCFLAATVSLPAFLLVYADWRKRRNAGGARRPTAAVDRVWVEFVAERICRYPVAVCVLALLFTAALAIRPGTLRFETNVVNLMPRGAESVTFQRRMMFESDLAPMTAIVTASSLPQLADMQRRAGEHPEIARFESVLDFVPVGGGLTEETRVRIQNLLDSFQPPSRAEPLRQDELAGTLRRLESALADGVEAAFGSGESGLVGPLEEARSLAEECAEIVTGADDTAVEHWNRGQREILDWMVRARRSLQAALKAEAPSLENLPEPLRRRLLTGSGQMLGLLHPAGDVFEPRQLDRFVRAARSVSPDATGFPVVFHKMSERITDGFYRAVGIGAVFVVLILLLDFRNLRDTALALSPLAVGVVWMIGMMRMLGLSFNFANLVAVPLVIGVGIDNGVHIVHRLRIEGRRGMHVVLRHTGRAIIISSLTTMIGFGSLATASHRGLSSLGVVLLLGVAACLVSSVVLLPNLLVALGVVER